MHKLFKVKAERTKKYKPYLDLRETEKAIRYIKTYFQAELSKSLNLYRVSAPITVTRRSGLNDYLSGVEEPVRFFVKSAGEEAEIVQSLAKWKRYALYKYGFRTGEGLYTDMNAIRPDEILDNLHSIYVDQWDWELIIDSKDRNLNYLKSVVSKIYGVIRKVEMQLISTFKSLPKLYLPDEIHFIHSEELEYMYPHLTPQEREDAICRQKGAVFLIGIGANLKSGNPHDGRAADYDDWWTITEDGRRGLNGDILVWYPPLNCTLELSSMGIRVDRNSLIKQLELKNEKYKLNFDYHQKIAENKLPLTIGGGIGQSRLCMFYLRKIHIGEVQSGIWSDDIRAETAKTGVPLL